MSQDDLVGAHPVRQGFAELLRGHLARLGLRHGEAAERIRSKRGEAPSRSTVQSWCLDKTNANATRPRNAEQVEQIGSRLGLSSTETDVMLDAYMFERDPDVAGHFVGRLERERALLQEDRASMGRWAASVVEQRRALPDLTATVSGHVPTWWTLMGRLADLEESRPGSIAALAELLDGERFPEWPHGGVLGELLAAWRDERVDRELVRRVDLAVAIRAVARSYRLSRETT